jgi:acyl carrier protein
VESVIDGDKNAVSAVKIPLGKSISQQLAAAERCNLRIGLCTGHCRNVPRCALPLGFRPQSRGPPSDHCPNSYPKTATGDPDLNVMKETLRILDEVLSLDGRSSAFTRDTPLLGAIPELDSMAVVTLITTLEEQLGIIVDDDDIDGSTFATVGSLADFVSQKTAA